MECEGGRDRPQGRRFLALLHELFDGPVHHQVISVAFLGLTERGGPEQVVAEGAATNKAHVVALSELGTGPVLGNRIERIPSVLVPGIRIVLGIPRGPLQGVKDLAAARRMVAVVAEVARQDDGVLQQRRLMAPAGPVGTEHIAVDAGPARIDPGHDSHSGRMTGGSCAWALAKLTERPRRSKWGVFTPGWLSSGLM